MKSSYASAQTAKPPNCQIRNNQLLARVTGFLLCIYGQKHWKLWLLGSVVPCFKQMVGVIPGKINSECFSPPSPFCVESQHPPLKQKQITSHPPPQKRKLENVQNDLIVRFILYLALSVVPRLWESICSAQESITYLGMLLL